MVCGQGSCLAPSKWWALKPRWEKWGGPSWNRCGRYDEIQIFHETINYLPVSYSPLAPRHPDTVPPAVFQQGKGLNDWLRNPTSTGRGGGQELLARGYAHTYIPRSLQSQRHCQPARRARKDFWCFSFLLPLGERPKTEWFCGCLFSTAQERVAYYGKI